jgi:hypothetical protein
MLFPMADFAAKRFYNKTLLQQNAVSQTDG